MVGEEMFPELEGIDVGKLSTRPKTSSTSRKAMSQTTAVDREGGRKRGKKMTLQMKWDAEINPKCQCGICSKKASDPDRVFPNKSMLWGCYGWKGGENSVFILVVEGMTCYYCLRVYQSRYAEEYRTLTD